MSPAAPTLTVAIATYNGRELLENVLSSLDAQSFRDFDVLVVDDCSSDGTAEWLAEQRPEVRLISHAVNRGVTAALNTGLASSEAELTMLLNNDMELDSACLGELVAAMRAHPEAGSAVGKLLSYYDRTVLDGAGDTFIWAGLGWRRGHGEWDVGQYETPQAIFGACGGAAVYRRSAVGLVGPFDEDFFAFYEDVDWSFRAQLAGLGCRYVPTAVAYHMGSATLGKGETDFTRYHTWRNSIWLVLKDYPAPLLLWHLPRVLANQVQCLLVAGRARKLALLLRVWRDAALAFPEIARKRRAVQRTRRVTLAQLQAAVRDQR